MKWGAAGVKIDFMNRDDQEMVRWYHKILKKAAAHHLMVFFHGAYKPTGTQRTYPHLITQEGVLGNEQNKVNARITPEHTVTCPSRACSPARWISLPAVFAMPPPRSSSRSTDNRW